MKYKYTRKQMANLVDGYENLDDFCDDLLAKADKEKEWTCPSCHKTGCICWKKDPLFKSDKDKPCYICESCPCVCEEEHTEDKLAMSYIKLSENEKKLLCDKGSLVGTDAKNPKKNLCDYVEKLINEYAFLTQMAHGSVNYHIGEVNEMMPTPPEEKIVSSCCGQPVGTRSSDEGTGHYYCLGCYQACDIKSVKPKDKERIKNEMLEIIKEGQRLRAKKKIQKVDVLPFSFGQIGNLDVLAKKINEIISVINQLDK